jgi:hypothetical protein
MALIDIVERLGQMGRIPIIVYFVKGNVLPPYSKGADGEAFQLSIMTLKKIVSTVRAITWTAARKGPFPRGKRLTLQWAGVIGKFCPEPKYLSPQWHVYQ